MNMLTTTAPRSRRNDGKIDRFQTLPIFTGCSHGEVTLAAMLIEQTTVRAGKVLIREGRQADQGFIVLSGRVGTTLRKIPQGEAGPGTLVGLGSMLDEWHYTRTAVALEEVEVLVIGERALAGLLSDVPRAARALRRSVRREGIS